MKNGTKFIICILLLVWLTSNNVFALKFPAIREFKSQNEDYSVTIEYGAWGGHGGARYTLKDREGKVLWTKIHDVAPYTVFVSDKGSMVVLGGDWAHNDPFIYKIAFYDKRGKFLKKHGLRVLTSAHAFSNDGKTFLLCHQAAGMMFGRNKPSATELICFATRTGEIKWQEELDHIEYSTTISNPRAITLSKNGKWILAETEKERVVEFYLFDIKGKRHWRKVFVDVKVKGLISDKGDYLTFITRDRKTIFRNEKGKVTLEKEEKFSIPRGGNIK